MDSSVRFLLCLSLMLALFSSNIHAFDITKLLGQHSEFSNFNNYLTQTNLADEINKRNTITVLAVENGAISSVASKSPETMKAIMSTHVILDYYDEKKLKEANNTDQPMTTLYQTSGHAVNQEGFVKVSLIGEGSFAFGSAVKGAPIDSELKKVVTSQPYNISILQVSKPIIFPGADSKKSDAQSPTQSAKAPVASSSKGAHAPSPSQEAKAPVSSSHGKAPSPSKSTTAPSPSKSTTAPSPSESATAPSPSDNGVADSPNDAADAPGSTAASPPEPDLAPGPVGDEEAAADAPTTTDPSGASTIHLTLVGAVIAFASLFIVS